MYMRAHEDREGTDTHRPYPALLQLPQRALVELGEQFRYEVQDDVSKAGRVPGTHTHTGDIRARTHT